MHSKNFTFLIRTLAAGLLLAGLLSIGLMTRVQAGPDWKFILNAAQSPAFSHLDIIINEVAWSGNVSDSDGEWMELYNPGGVDIDLTGWNLVSDDGIPNISLTGVIRAGEYYLLERTDDKTIIDIIADQIYYEGLDNQGEILRLLDPDKNMIDSANLVDGKWSAGSSFPDYASMERIGLVADETTAWGNNNGIKINGSDIKNKPIRGTPRQVNSLYVLPEETATFTSEPTLTETATPTRFFSPTPTLPAPKHLVISQFRTRGPDGADDEFVEIFNPGNAPVNIGGWQIKRSGECGLSAVNLLVIPDGVVLLSGQRYLAVSQTSGLGAYDQVFSASISDGGGLALAQTNGNIVDQVGLCTNTLYREGSSLLPISGNLNQSYTRKPVNGISGCVDTDQNSDDFYILTPSEPQGMHAPIHLCPGVLTATPTSKLAATPTPTTGPGGLVINEFLPHPGMDWNGDGSANVEDEFIEIMNIGNQPVKLKGWRLDDSENSSNNYFLPEISLPPGGVAVFYGKETGLILNDIGDMVRLMNSNSQVVDSLTYPAIKIKDQSWCRQPDGTGALKYGCPPTPGQLNIWKENGAEASLPQITDHPKEPDQLVCPFAEPLKLDVYPSACTGWGLNISSSSLWRMDVIFLVTGMDKRGVVIK